MEEKNACGGQSEWEAPPHALWSSMQHKTENITAWNTHKDVSYEGIPDERLHVLDRTQGIGKHYLQTVAQLIEEKWNHQRERHRHHFWTGGEQIAERGSYQEHAAC